MPANSVSVMNAVDPTMRYRTSAEVESERYHLAKGDVNRFWMVVLKDPAE